MRSVLRICWECQVSCPAPVQSEWPLVVTKQVVAISIQYFACHVSLSLPCLPTGKAVAEIKESRPLYRGSATALPNSHEVRKTYRTS